MVASEKVVNFSENIRAVLVVLKKKERMIRIVLSTMMPNKDIPTALYVLDKISPSVALSTKTSSSGSTKAKGARNNAPRNMIMGRLFLILNFENCSWLFRLVLIIPRYSIAAINHPEVGRMRRSIN